MTTLKASSGVTISIGPTKQQMMNKQPIVKNSGSGQGCPCGDPFCGGCATGMARSQPNYVMGGVIPSSTVPVLLTPGGYNVGPGVTVPTGLLNAINSGTTITNTSFTAYDVLKFLEQEIPVKVGMLNAANFLIHRITVYDREKWQDKIMAEIEILKSKFGDKIGNLGDQRLVGLDEPYDPDGGPLVVETSSATGKVAVHLARRNTYQAYKVTILALVKAQ